MVEPNDLVSAKKVPEEADAIRLKAFLENAGIRCEIFSYHASAYDGLMLHPGYWGWGEVRVLARDLERAEAIIADIESSTANDQPGSPPGA